MVSGVIICVGTGIAVLGVFNLPPYPVRMTRAMFEKQREQCINTVLAGFTVSLVGCLLGMFAGI